MDRFGGYWFFDIATNDAANSICPIRFVFYLHMKWPLCRAVFPIATSSFSVVLKRVVLTALLSACCISEPEGPAATCWPFFNYLLARFGGIEGEQSIEANFWLQRALRERCNSFG